MSVKGSTDPHLSCLDSFLAASFNYVSQLNLPIYIIGDVNSNILESDGLASKDLVSFYRSFNLLRLVTTTIQVTESISSLSDTKRVQEAKVLHSCINDHDLVYVNLRLKRPRIIHSLIHSFIPPCPTHPFIRLFIYSIPSFILCSATHSFMYSFLIGMRIVLKTN